MDLVGGAIGTPAGNAGPNRSTELGTLDTYLDGNGDQFNFGSAPTVDISGDWTIVWESYLDGVGGGFDAYPGVAIFARGAGDPLRLGYSSDAAYDDIYVGTRGGTQTSFLLPSGLTKTGQRHWGVVSSVAGTRTAWVNGQACTNTTAGSLAVITDDTRVGGTSGTTSDWSGGIRQVRFYARGWSYEDAVRFYTPATRDSLFRPYRRKLYAVASAAPSGINGEGAITEAGDTLSSAATVDVAATSTITEAGDSLSSAGTVDVQSSGAIVEAGDTVFSAGTVAVQAAGTITEAGDTLSSAATVDVSAAGAITEAGDTLSGEGVVGAAPVEATGAITEAGDTLSSAATVDVQAAGALTEAGDTVSSAGAVAVQASGAITEDGDAVAGEGTAASSTPISASGAVTEAGDTLSAAGSTGVFVEGNVLVFCARSRATTWVAHSKPTKWTAGTKSTTWIARRAA